MESTPGPQAAPKLRRRRSLATLVVLVAAGLLLWAFLTHDPRALWHEGILALQKAGPWAFFSAMALLPAFGFPLAPFNIAAGPAFAPSLGLPSVLLAASVAIAFNVSLSYLLASRLLRPALQSLLQWVGYTIPNIPSDKQLTAAFLVRITPGPPFFIQSYLLGITRIRFPAYLLASWSVPTLYAALMIIGGDALASGQTRGFLFALAALGVLVLGLKILRRKPQG